MSKARSPLALFAFGAAVAGAAWLGSRHTRKNPATRIWYKGLEKPKYNPPDAAFPVVWAALYSLIAYSGWRVWQADKSPERSRALRLWAAQLAANARWSKLFFGKHRPDRALVDALILESLIIRYIVTSDKVDHSAAMGFVPYAVWIAFATLLNAEIVLRNPDAEQQFASLRAA